MTVRWQDRRPGFYLRTERGILEHRREHVRRFVAWLRTQVAVEHYVPVYVVDAHSLARKDGARRKLAQGLTRFPLSPARSRTPPTIYVAAGRRRTRNVLAVLAHEVAHYVEFARKGNSTERGKDSAARRLLYKYEREVLHDV